MKVIPVGTKVILEEGIVGVVENITIYEGNYVTYNCSWWNGRSRDCESFQSDRVSPVTDEKVNIGFKA